MYLLYEGDSEVRKAYLALMTSGSKIQLRKIAPDHRKDQLDCLSYSRLQENLLQEAAFLEAVSKEK